MQEPPAMKRMPINIETRPSGGEYQQIGILTKESIVDEDVVLNVTTLILLSFHYLDVLFIVVVKCIITIQPLINFIKSEFH